MTWALVMAIGAACSPTSGSSPAPASNDEAVASTAPAPAAAPKRRASAYVAAVEGSRLEADIRFIAKPRPPGSEQHRAVRQRCAERLKEAGFTVSRQPFDGGENVIGTKPGKTARQVILSAHYDHIPYCSGADDNATGVAIVWEAARVLGAGSFESTLVLACWDGEEAGLHGSAAYARRARQQKDDIAVVISLDGVGFTNERPGSQRTPPGFDRMFPVMGKRLSELDHRANFVAVIGDSSAALGVAAIERAADEIALPVLGDALGVIQRLALLDAARSDHASFWLQGFPAILVTDTANFRSPYYHCGRGDDSVETLDLAFTARVGRAIVGGTADLLESRDASAAPGGREIVD